MKNFEETVKEMSAKEIIMAMVNSLIPPPNIRIRMCTFGTVEKEYEPVRLFGFIPFGVREKKICFGCAATNTICQISGKSFDATNIGARDLRADFLNCSYYFLYNFEDAINSLRSGNIISYNHCARRIGIAIIKHPFDSNLPFLCDEYTIKQLEEYKKLADYQD